MTNSVDVSKLLEGWQPPDALRRSWPREVCLTRAGVALLVLCVFLVLGGVAVAVGLSAEAARQAADARLLRERGVDTRAQITRLWITSGEHSEYRVEYLVFNDGYGYSGSASVRHNVWKKLMVGTTIAVRYVPSKPTLSYPLITRPPSTPRWLPYAIGGALALTGLLLPLMIRRQKHLLADGRPAPAVVTRFRKVYTNHGASQTWMYYEFPLLGGGVCKGRAGVSRRPPEGSVICILYDPDNPRRSAPYPMSLVKLATP